MLSGFPPECCPASERNGVRLPPEYADKGNIVCRLARNFSPPRGMKCIAARATAIFLRKREDEGTEFQDRVRSDRWEVVLPELVYEPV
jgi:hypothetical protein